MTAYMEADTIYCTAATGTGAALLRAQGMLTLAPGADQLSVEERTGVQMCIFIPVPYLVGSA
jgi:hypothetical protein